VVSQYLHPDTIFEIVYRAQLFVVSLVHPLVPLGCSYVPRLLLASWTTIHELMNLKLPLYGVSLHIQYEHFYLKHVSISALFLFRPARLHFQMWELFNNVVSVDCW
jgi:hypothetical protein